VPGGARFLQTTVRELVLADIAEYWWTCGESRQFRQLLGYEMEEMGLLEGVSFAFSTKA